MDIKQFIIGLEVGLGVILLGFLLGWIFPVEGPLDYLYDEYASQPAHKSPSSYVPLKPYQIVIDINDMSEEDFEALQEVFYNK